MGRHYSHSLSTDAVDRYNYKWMAMLLLLLSLTAFIIPLHPSYQNETEESTPAATAMPQTKTSKSPQIDVACWCPAEFTGAYVVYANAYCKNSLLAALRGHNDTPIYLPIESPIPLTPDERVSSFRVDMKGYIDKKRQEKQHDEKREDIKGRVQKLVTFQAPVMLLLGAILLMLPQVLWSFLFACCGSFNIEETLQSASSNKRANEEISASIATVVRTCPNSLSTLYLLKKVMSVVVVLVLLIVVCQSALPMVEELDKDLDSVGKKDGPTSSDSSSSTDGDSIGMSEIPKIVLCDFKIRQLQTVQSWTVQCSVQVGDEKETVPQILSSSPAPQTAINQRNLVEFESVLFKIVTALLAILVVGNVFSLCSWLCKLLITKSRNALGLTGNTAMDVVFLVQMARINASVDVCRKLAHANSASDPFELKE